MKIRELFLRDVERDIPPVVYFHQQRPEHVDAEVSEYIITGGYPESDPRHRRVPNGIHEQYVKLLRAIAADLSKEGGPDLPASWISGFYGSGKSIFAKLLGLALDGATLPDGGSLADALLARDTSPLAFELGDAWDAVVSRVRPISVVFDIGGVARDNEHIHAAVVRQVQQRLDYCPRDALVADYELRLEREDRWDDFCEVAETTLGRPWMEAKSGHMCEDEFSAVLHAMRPDLYTEPLSWIDSRAGSPTLSLSPNEATEAIADMLRFRAPGRTLFIVVDEVSQYIYQDGQRMLKLQTFVSSLGERLHGGVWLLVTGQEKLEEESEASNLGKLKGRFPPRLRVHLAATNIRDVVHKRLLQKKPEHEALLRDLYERYQPNLQVFAYKGETILEEDFVEVYPMLPGHIDLLLEITSALRTRSTRSQSDDHAIRGLLQLLGELFRTQGLADGELGALVTLDAIYAVLESALDSDVQTTMSRVFQHCAATDDALADRAARAVALLQLVADRHPASAELVAAALYDRLDRGDQTQPIAAALERLRDENLLGYSEKHGYKIQSSAGQEWERIRRDITVTPEQQNELVQDKLKELIADAERPRISGVSARWAVRFSDSRAARDAALVDPRSDLTFTADFHFVPAEERKAADWVRRSADDLHQTRLVWVTGEMTEVQKAARDLARSQRMYERYRSRRESLTSEQLRLLLDEEHTAGELDEKLKRTVADSWMAGRLYFQGREIDPADQGATFAQVLLRVAERVLPEVYSAFDPTVVTETELMQLLELHLSGVSTKFLDDGLGILALDAGKYMPTCTGRLPTRIWQFIKDQGGTAGATLFDHFARPPYGWSASAIRACLAGLLRAGRVEIRPESGLQVTSVQDPDVKALFRLERGLRRSDIFPYEDEIPRRCRVALCQLFEERFGASVDRENDAVADALFQYLPAQADTLRSVEERLNRMPGPPPTPRPLQKLHRALEDCRRSRQVKPTVQAACQHLKTLQNGLQQLALFGAELTEEVIEQVSRVGEVQAYQLAQLREQGPLDEEARAAAERLDAQLALDRPWREITTLAPDLETIRAAYRTHRARLLADQEAEAAAARARIKARKGFERLTADQAHHVLRPISRAVADTTAEAIAPTLRELADRFPKNLQEAEEEANDRLDALLTRVVKVRHSLTNRTIAGKKELDAIIDDLRERVEPHLDGETVVRLT